MDTRGENKPGGLDVAELARRLLARNLANLARRLQGGETLTAAELAQLREVATGTAEGPATVRTYVQLGHALGVTRRCLQNWRNRFDDTPNPRSDGRHDVAAWREWMQRHGIDAAAAVEEAGDSGDLIALKSRLLLAQIGRMEFQLGILQRHYVPREDVVRAGAALAAAVRKVVGQLHLAAPDFPGLTVEEVDALLKRKEDDILQQLHQIPTVLSELLEITPENTGALDPGEEDGEGA